MTQLERNERRAELGTEIRRLSAIEADAGVDAAAAGRAYAAKKRLTAELARTGPDPLRLHVAEREAAFHRRVTEMRIRGGVR